MAEIEPLDSPNRPASVPRRFGVGVLLILMTVFAVLFGFLSWLKAPPISFVVIAGMIGAVSIGQVLLFEGKRPRKASIIAGMVCLLLLLIAGEFAEEWQANPRNFRMRDEFLGTIFFWLVFGIPFSYATGVAVSAIFLIVELLFGTKPADVNVELQPFTVSDIGLLEEWLKSEPICLAWTRGNRESFPDSAALCAFLNLPSPQSPQPDRLCFKAIARYEHDVAASNDDDDEPVVAEIVGVGDVLTVGYVELTSIHTKRKHATIARALVDPDARQRPHVSLAMLVALLHRMRKSIGVRLLIINMPRNFVIESDCYMRFQRLFPNVVSTADGLPSRFVAPDRQVIDELRKVDVRNLSPLAAKALVERWQRLLRR